MKSKTLEDVLAYLEAKKAQTAEYLAKHAQETEAATAKQNGLKEKLAALPQKERRKVLDDAGLKHISAAPPPQKPIRSSYTQPVTPAAPPAIDWRYWRHMPEIRQWEACALSLTINPDNMKQHPQAWMAGPGSGPIFTDASFPSKAVQSDFNKRLRLLGASLFSSGYFTAVNNLVRGGRQLATVNLREFAAWGLHVELDAMPPELVAMAEAATTAPGVMPALNNTMPAPEFSSDLPDTVEHSQVKRRTWREVAWPYVVKTFKAGQYSTAKEFYRALENKAGASDSPFEKGTGVHAHSLYVREISEKVALKTIQNVWADIKASG